MDFHSVASIFPLMTGKEFEDFVEDIRQNGLMEPISTFEGKIIDGRNRYRACLEAGVKPRFVEFDGSSPLINFVVSLNLHRRHLSVSQLGMIGARIKSIYEEEARKRQEATRSKPGEQVGHVRANLPEPDKGRSRDKAADTVGVSPRTIEHGSKVLEDGVPELVNAVDSGEIAVSKASQIASLPPEEQTEVISKPHVAHNSGDNEWYTPGDIIDAARTVLGEFDLDPASSSEANAIIKAKQFHDEDSNGLDQDWAGIVWMNPPYASALTGKFAGKLVDHLEDGTVTAAIALVNNATETKWFQLLLANAAAVCFPAGRVKFWHPRKVSTPLQGQAILFFGDYREDFRHAFEDFGVVCDVMG